MAEMDRRRKYFISKQRDGLGYWVLKPPFNLDPIMFDSFELAKRDCLAMVTGSEIGYKAAGEVIHQTSVIHAYSVTNPAEWAIVPQDADHFLRKLEAKLVAYNVYFAGELVQAIKDLENDPCGQTLKQLHKATCKIICNRL